MSDPIISVVINAHAERRGYLERAIASVRKQIEPPDYELIIVADRPTPEVQRIVDEAAPTRTVFVDVGDLGPARNAAVASAKGRIVAFLDGDDAFGSKWLRSAFEFSRKFDHDNWCLHPRFSIMFGMSNFFHVHFGDNDPEFDARDLIQFNQWSALAFAPKSVFERFPYAERTKKAGNEDWTWNVATYSAGISHQCVPDGVHMIRLKGDHTSLAARVLADKTTIGKHSLFDRRDLPEPKRDPSLSVEMPAGVYSQVQFAHHEVGEYRAFLTPDMESRIYPRQKIFADQGWLRDALGDAEHVVLVERLVRGGAEQYALNWTKALVDAGHKVALLQTGIGPAPWTERATKTGARIVQWFRQKQLQPAEEAMALQHALIQLAPKSTFVCNSSLGWALLHENHLLLGERVLCASFSNIPEPPGFTRHPAYYLSDVPDTLTIVSDNERHAERLRAFHGIDKGDRRIIVIPPLADYRGPFKRAQLQREKIRVLWAGRGSHEKQPAMIPHVAQAMVDRADFHVWGEVQPVPHALPNLKYRGPFDGFENIDGAYDCLLITSLTEGMPNVALEAAQAGLPIVSSDVGGVGELTKYLFPVHNKPAEVQIRGAVAALDACAADHPDVEAARNRVNEWKWLFPKSVLAATWAAK